VKMLLLLLLLLLLLPQLFLCWIAAWVAACLTVFEQQLTMTANFPPPGTVLRCSEEATVRGDQWHRLFCDYDPKLSPIRIKLMNVWRGECEARW
jgi:hypothetical protein